MSTRLTRVQFGEFLRPNSRPYTLGFDEDAQLVGMRLYGAGPFYRELKPAMRIAKKTHFVIRTGDVIYNKLFAWKGAFGIVPPELDGMLVSDKFPTFELDTARVESSYLKWFFRCPQVWEQARDMSTGSAALSKLTLNPPKVLLLTVPLPQSKDVQQRVVSRIEALERRIVEARLLRSQAAAERQALVASALGRYTNNAAVTGKLADVLREPPRNGWSPKCDNSLGGTAVLSLGAVTGFRYRGAEHKRTSLPVRADAHYWLEPGDLLITRSNTPELVGHAAIYDGAPRPCIYPDLMMKLTLLEVVDPRFAWYWLQSSVVREFIVENSKGTSPTMKKISQGTVMNIPFPTDLELPMQRRIVAQLDALQERVDALAGLQSGSAAGLDAMLPSVLDRAFTGKS